MTTTLHPFSSIVVLTEVAFGFCAERKINRSYLSALLLRSHVCSTSKHFVSATGNRRRSGPLDEVWSRQITLLRHGGGGNQQEIGRDERLKRRREESSIEIDCVNSSPRVASCIFVGRNKCYLAYVSGNQSTLQLMDNVGSQFAGGFFRREKRSYWSEKVWSS